MSGADEPSERQSGWTAQEVRRLKERQFELALALADLNVSAMQIQTLVLLLRSGGDADKVNEQIGRIESSFKDLGVKVSGILAELGKELGDGELLGKLDG